VRIVTHKGSGTTQRREAFIYQLSLSAQTQTPYMQHDILRGAQRIEVNELSAARLTQRAAKMPKFSLYPQRPAFISAVAARQD